jgi:hypothetical protein
MANFYLMVFLTTNGRLPQDKREMDAIRAETKRLVGDAGYRLTKGNFGPPSQLNYYTDDIVVCMAFDAAIRTGRTVVILTSDDDLYEQAHRLQYMLVEQYHSMLLAEDYAKNWSAYRPVSVADEEPWNSAFEGSNNVLISRPSSSADILPPPTLPVRVECWSVRESVVRLVFFAELGMRRLLDMKGRTRLNTESLGSRNCHWSLDFLGPPARYAHHAIVGQDLLVKSFSDEVAGADYVKVITPFDAPPTRVVFSRSVPHLGTA